MFSLISAVKSEFIPPLAVIPFTDEGNAQISSLHEFANASNSNLIYAQDEFGNNLAVGVFVTEEFAQNVTEGNYSTHDGQQTEQAAWVGAVEECVTEAGE